jgi:signal transduction histidine kinase
MYHWALEQKDDTMTSLGLWQRLRVFLLGLLDRWIPSNIKEMDLREVRRSRLLVGYSLHSAVSSFVVFLSMIPIEGLGGIIGTVCLFNSFGYIFCIWLLKRVRNNIWPSFVLIFQVIVSLLVVVSLTGGLRSLATYWLALAPMIGVFLLGIRRGAVVFAASLVALIVLYVLDSSSIAVIPSIPMPMTGAVLSFIAFFLLLLFICVVFATGWLFESSLQQTLDELSHSSQRTHDMEIAKQAAEQANLAKSDFLANMSHELRTPLNAIIGYAEMLEEELEEEELTQYVGDVEKIHRSGKHLLLLINDLLDLSKIEAGKIELCVEQITLEMLLPKLHSNVEPMLRKNGNGFSCEQDEHVKQLWSDPTRLQQILLNLLSNAAKFTKDGEVSLQVTRLETAPGNMVLEEEYHAIPLDSQDGWIVFAVTDTGMGMDEKVLARLFSKFYQADSSATRQFNGTGLGLAISRRLARMMGGDILVTSQPGEGSCFTLVLPYLTELPESMESSS